MRSKARINKIKEVVNSPSVSLILNAVPVGLAGDNLMVLIIIGY